MRWTIGLVTIVTLTLTWSSPSIVEPVGAQSNAPESLTSPKPSESSSTSTTKAGDGKAQSPAPTTTSLTSSLLSATTTTPAPTTTAAPKTTAAPTTAATSPRTAVTSPKVPDEAPESVEDGEDVALKASAVGSLRVCPGVCVATRISDYCEAVLNVDGLCKASMKCCVTKSLFGDSDPPPELVILNEGSSTAAPSTAAATTSTTAAATTTKTVATTTTPRSTTTTTTKPKPRTTTTAAVARDENRCKGTCVTGFFSYLCDHIDSKATCANGGKCCLTRQGAASPSEVKDSPSSSSATSSTAAAATTTTQATTTTSTTTATPQRPRCPGVCLPGLMSAFCSHPSVVVKEPANLCERGSVCCDSKTRDSGSRPSGSGSDSSTQRPSRPTTKGPGSAMADILSNPLTSLLAGPILSSLAGAAFPKPASSPSSGDKSDVSPQRPQATGTRPPVSAAPTTTPTTTSAPQVVDTRPYCPGTCMAPILSFSCFSNAEITDLFRCPSAKVVCCAPKSAIRELRPATGAETDLPQLELPRPGAGFRPPPLARPGTNVVTPPLQPPAVVTGPRPAAPKPVHNNKFVCGVKGTNRDRRSVMQTLLESTGENATTTSLTSGFRQGRVVGGRDALPGEYCWQVALINSLNQYLCGGALIGTQWVLTAAHCVTNIVRSGDAIYVRVGDHDLTSRYGSPGAQTLRVATTYIHHNHNSQTLDNDIALLKLQGQAELKPGVCIICLPSRGSMPETGRRCTVTGYGYMGETGPIPLRVREAEVPIVSESECVRQINAVTEKIFIMPASSFCAGGEAGNDACQGDGGGPLVCEDDGYYELSGLVSWGFGCGRAQVPGVYVKVSSFISWINQIISVNNV
nr:EOG090X03V0 [Ilyocryptus agilis]